MPERYRVFDTVVLSNFLLADATGILLSRYGRRGIVTWEVYDEIMAGSVSYPPLAALDRIIDKGEFCLAALSRRERRVYAGLLDRLGTGEASAIAVARGRHGVVCSDDKAARRECSALGVRFTGTIGILKAACMDSEIPIARADRILRVMVDHGFYSPVRRVSDVM